MNIKRKMKNAVAWMGLIFLAHSNVLAQEVDHPYSLTVGTALVSGFSSPDLEIQSRLNATDTLSIRTDVIQTRAKISPLFLRFDWQLDPRNSFGIHLTYNGFYAYGYQMDSIWEPALNDYNIWVKPVTYNYHRFRVQLAYTRHFYIDRPKFNTYFTAAIGANLLYERMFLENDRVEPMWNFSTFENVKLSMRLCYGMQYNFTSRLSLKSEVAFGGPFLNLGVSVKL